MKKPDTILRQTTIAAIKRNAMIPHKWELTRFYEADTVDDLASFQDELNLREKLITCCFDHCEIDRVDINNH